MIIKKLKELFTSKSKLSEPVAFDRNGVLFTSLYQDIDKRIKDDFKEGTERALSILKEQIDKAEYINHPRIVRCIIYLANGDIRGLEKSIEQAKGDPRDIMLLAEYIGTKEGEELVRVRDFNNTFGNESI